MPSEAFYTLPEVGSVTTVNARQKLSEQLAAVAALSEYVQTDAAASFEPKFFQQAPAGALVVRLDHLIDKLAANLKSITAKLPEIDSYSVQAGFPWGVSVSVTFKAGSTLPAARTGA